MKFLLRPFLLLSAAALSVLLAAACYDAAKLPPCSPGGAWPDPCAALSRDAGAEAGRAP